MVVSKILRRTSLLAAGGLVMMLASAPPTFAQQQDGFEILADTQQKTGTVYILTGNVEIRFRGVTFRADKIVYDQEKGSVAATGNVSFAAGDDLLEAESATYNLNSQTGSFTGVVGTVGVPPQPSTEHLVTDNPYYFEADAVERNANGSYIVRNGWVTNCRPGNPKWRLSVAKAVYRPNRDVRVYRARFILKGVPLLATPYWWISAASTPRKSGFLMPRFGNDSQRGLSAGVSYFWAINPHADLTMGAQVFTEGGWTQTGDLRARPTEHSRLSIHYFGAEASDIIVSGQPQGVDVSGQFARVQFSNTWGSRWRAVADINHLSSLRFRQRFAETFNSAVESEVRSTGFMTGNWNSAYVNVFSNRYQNFQSTIPETSVSLLVMPALEAGLRPQPLKTGAAVPVYFSFDAQVAGLQRDEPRFRSPELYQRMDFHPRVTVPMRLGLFRLTPTFSVRTTRYGARLIDDPLNPGAKIISTQARERFTQEVSIDLGLPAISKVFSTGGWGVRHAIEPRITYRYRNGVRDVGEILRFDERDLLIDTHELEYSFTQRFFLRRAASGGNAREVVRWTLRQKYFFDPSMRGSIQAGRRNVFEPYVSLTPFAFVTGDRRFSPVISDIRFMGKNHDLDYRVDYDTVVRRVTATRLRAGTRLAGRFRMSAAHFSLRDDPVLQRGSNQVRLLVRYGDTFGRGWNGLTAMSWNIREDFFQNLVGQISYNWDCCGVAVEFRRLGLGAVRSENEYRFSFTVANVGTVGTVRNAEDLY